MLATRLATAAVLIPLIIIGILTLPTWAVGVIFAVVMALGAWEWARLLGWDEAAPRGAFTAFFAVLAAVLVVLDYVSVGIGYVPALVVAVGCCWWLAVVYWLVRYPAAWSASVGRHSVGVLVSLIVLCAAVAAVPIIHSEQQGAWLLLVFFALVWGADTGAYFAGRGLGRHRLAPAISPGKTWEGAIGGVLAALVVAVVGGCALQYSGLRLAGFVLLGAWIGIVSIFGDLTLSMFKRHVGIKDTGALFPGHGGVLDRVDSILAAAPWFVAGFIWLPHG